MDIYSMRIITVTNEWIKIKRIKFEEWKDLIEICAKVYVLPSLVQKRYEWTKNWSKG